MLRDERGGGCYGATGGRVVSDSGMRHGGVPIDVVWTV